jgi:hypothetical protein
MKFFAQTLLTLPFVVGDLSGVVKGMSEKKKEKEAREYGDSV